ncbi:MAG: 4-hydroxy-tetrahydrodipicolinate reductase [Microbacteriaceae bacterium]
MAARVAVVGARGRMGRLVTGILDAASDLQAHALIGSQDALDGILGADVVIDVTVPAVSQTVVERAIAAGIPVVVGTSGWTGERIAALGPLLGSEPRSSVLIVPNFSVGSVLATRFAAAAARHFESIEIVEAHHAGKLDSPSGTAVRTAELIGEARRELGPVLAPHVDQRARGQQVASVPVHSLRMRGVIARQEVLLGGTGELLTISHETTSPESYTAGILLALRRAPALRGVVLGLDALLGL